MLLIAKILLTIATLGYSAVPALFDSDKTHATNPGWDPHARFHVVWQVSSYVYLALLALYLIWTSGSDTRTLWLVAMFAAFAYGGFWTAVVFRWTYGGTLLSETNPVPAFRWNIAGLKFDTDANITLFAPALLILLAAMGALIKA